MMPAPARRTLQSVVGIALAGVLFVAVVLLAETLLRGARVDLTADQLYTVSSETREVIDSLDEPVTLTLYFSHDAAEGVPFVRQYAQRVRELLEEYAAYADGRIEIRTVDPKPLTEARDEAVEYGLEPVPAGSTDARIYLGLVGTNRTDGLEVIEFFEPERERFLEYDITRLVWSLQNPDKPVVGIMSRLPITETYNPGTGQVREPWAIVDRLEQIAEVQRVETPTERIDPDIDVLVVAHPFGHDDATLSLYQGKGVTCSYFQVESFAIRFFHGICSSELDALAISIHFTGFYSTLYEVGNIQTKRIYYL